MQPSKYQSAIFDFIAKSHGNLLIEAVAGSGKTTTIVESLKLLGDVSSILFLAFNKSIAEELTKRVPKNVQAKTFHSVCYGAIRKALGHSPKIESNKSRQILKNSLGEYDYPMMSKGDAKGDEA